MPMCVLAILNMRPISYILPSVILGITALHAENKFDSLISEMNEVELFIDKPTDKSPIMLSIHSAAKLKNVEINANSFLTGFFTFLTIDYKDGSCRMKLFSCESTAFRRPNFQLYNLDAKIPLDFLTASIFNNIYQEASDLRLKDAKSVSIKIYFENLTKTAKNAKIKYATNKLIFSKDELLNIANKYTKEIDPIDFLPGFNVKVDEKR